MTQSKTESFTYDNLNRLLTATVTGQSALTVNYATTGNITSKTDVGSYTYHPSKINAVTNVTNTPGNIPTLTQSITYTPFFQPATISENNYQLTYTYAADYERIKGEFKQNGTTLYTRYYFGNYEKEVTSTTVRHFYYISNGESLVALVVRENSADTYYYTYTDHLGSILTATNSAGTVVAEQNFDPWGRKRNTTNWTYASVPSVPTWLYRGYTGHEHLPEFGLINMNGRLYDPILNRMLSADNEVPGVFSTQGYNRYAYALNNPLLYNDPDGEFPLLAAALIGAAVFGTGNLVTHAIRGDVNNFGDGLRYFAQGAFAGAALTTGLVAGASVPILGTVIKGAGLLYAGTSAVGFTGGVIQGVFTGNWNALANTGRILLGNFYLDENRSFFGGVWQGISRYSWELPQSTLGYSYTQVRNALGGVDRVDYFGGVTFSTTTNTDNRRGVSIGNNINVWLRNDRVNITGDPLFMHEYGHTFDSQIFGFSYLFAVGIPSLISASNQRQIDGEPAGVNTHDFRWYEMSANRHAARYFGRNFGINWNTDPFRGFTFETFFPRRRR